MLASSCLILSTTLCRGMMFAASARESAMAETSAIWAGRPVEGAEMALPMGPPMKGSATTASSSSSSAAFLPFLPLPLPFFSSSAGGGGGPTMAALPRTFLNPSGLPSFLTTTMPPPTTFGPSTTPLAHLSCSSSSLPIWRHLSFRSMLERNRRSCAYAGSFFMFIHFLVSSPHLATADRRASHSDVDQAFRKGSGSSKSTSTSALALALAFLPLGAGSAFSSFSFALDLDLVLLRVEPALPLAAAFSSFTGAAFFAFSFFLAAAGFLLSDFFSFFDFPFLEGAAASAGREARTEEFWPLPLLRGAEASALGAGAAFFAALEDFLAGALAFFAGALDFLEDCDAGGSWVRGRLVS
mmetsp:Transcript_22726/g.45361  ORF Transcript_22726/g.45361 Transcript_22726/m.45361 type:complete len:355 (-) Transcript_22726:176-1240(-)